MIAFIQSVWTIVVMITFLGIVFWAYSSRRHADFEEAARLPFEEGELTESKQSSSE